VVGSAIAERELLNDTGAESTTQREQEPDKIAPQEGSDNDPLPRTTTPLDEQPPLLGTNSNDSELSSFSVSDILGNVRSHWHVVVLGQVLSFLLACTGAAQATLSFECHLSAPTFTIGMFYFALALCLVPVYLQQRRARKRCTQRWRHQERGGGEQSGTDAEGDGLQVTSSNDADNGFLSRIMGNPQPKATEGSRVGPFSEYRHVPGPVAERDEDVVEIEVQRTGTQQQQRQQQQRQQQQQQQQQQQPTYTFLYCIQLQAPWWMYLIASFIDVYANYFTVLAFKYTTITSVTLLDALAIPTSMVLSKLFLDRRYSTIHFVGVAACSVGIGLNFMQDYREDRADASDNSTSSESYPYKLRGDFLALLGGVMFGVNNVVGEFVVRRLGGVNEYLGMLGTLATVICFVQSAALERDAIAEFFGSDEGKEDTCKERSLWYLLSAYFVASVLSYLGGARFLQISEATFFNLSLLTGDLWSVAFSVVAEGIVPRPLFFVALAFILGGVVIYEMAPTPVLEDRRPGEGVDGVLEGDVVVGHANAEGATMMSKHRHRRSGRYDLALQQLASSSSSSSSDDEVELQATRSNNTYGGGCHETDGEGQDRTLC